VEIERERCGVYLAGSTLTLLKILAKRRVHSANFQPHYRCPEIYSGLPATLLNSVVSIREDAPKNKAAVVYLFHPIGFFEKKL
jgi:hypothetical protein